MIGRLRKSGTASGGISASRKTTEVLFEEATPHDADPTLPAEPSLIMLQGDLPGQVYRLRVGRQLIGRRSECEIRLRERAVSGIHAEVIWDHDGVVINDLESTNGTLVNGLPIKTPVPLSQGSIIRFGNCVFKYVDSSLDVAFLESLHARGITDQLTGTFNQSYLMTRLAFVLDTVSAERPLSIVAFDFDDFKQVNDQHGHAAGDHVLRASCALIRKIAVRPEDLFARMGGEEFVIVMPNAPAALGGEYAERVRAALDANTFEYEGRLIHLTSSFGVTTTSSPTDRAETLLAAADELLYRSKREGRNRVSQ